MQVLNIKSLISQILQANNKIADRLDKVKNFSFVFAAHRDAAMKIIFERPIIVASILQN